MKIVNTCLFFISFLAFTNTYAQEQNIPLEKAPQDIRTYVKKHFKYKKISEITKETEDSLMRYEIRLINGVKITMNLDFGIEKIDGTNGPLPSSVIPNRIANYVKKNYPDHFIDEWSKEGINQKVELDNDIDLLFNKSGKFLHIYND